MGVGPSTVFAAHRGTVRQIGQNERNARILQISGQNGNRPGQLLN